MSEGHWFKWCECLFVLGYSTALGSLMFCLLCIPNSYIIAFLWGDSALCILILPEDLVPSSSNCFLVLVAVGYNRQWRFPFHQIPVYSVYTPFSALLVIHFSETVSIGKIMYAVYQAQSQNLREDSEREANLYCTHFIFIIVAGISILNTSAVFEIVNISFPAALIHKTLKCCKCVAEAKQKLSEKLLAKLPEKSSKVSDKVRKKIVWELSDKFQKNSQQLSNKLYADQLL